MNRNRKCMLLSILLPLSLFAGSVPKAAKAEDVGMSTERLKRIEQMLLGRIAKGEMAGAVAVVARKGKIAYLTAQGVMDLESKQAVTPATMFRIASMTKPVTGVAAMMMLEEGKIRLNDPVSRYIPEFKGMKVAMAAPAPVQGVPGPGNVIQAPPPAGRGGGRGGATPNFTTVAATREITIKDLMTHVSGLSSGPMGASSLQKVARKQGETLADYIPRLGSTVLEFQPGTQWMYSAQAAHDTLGRIVEIASGMPFDKFLQTRLFDPLGMKDISFWPSEAQWPRVASVYNLNSGKLVKNNNPNGMSSQIYFMGSGGLISTAEDYLPFGMMLANGGEFNGHHILGAKTVELMRSVHVPASTPGRSPGEGFGLNMRVVEDNTKYNGLVSNGTFGWSGVYGTHFFVDPVENVVAVLLVQTSNREVNRDFEDLVMQAIIAK